MSFESYLHVTRPYLSSLLASTVICKPSNVPAFIMTSNSKYNSANCDPDNPLFDAIHHHDMLHIWYCTDGQYSHFIYGKATKVGSGSLVIVPPYTEHSTGGDALCTLSALDFTYEFVKTFFPKEHQNMIFTLQHLRNADGTQPFLYFSEEKKAALDRLFSELKKKHLEFSSETSKSKYIFDAEYCIPRILRTVEIIYEEYISKFPVNKLTGFLSNLDSMKTVSDFINENYTRKLSLRDVCRLAYLSPNRFCAVFKATFGIPFVEFVLQRRMFHARELLVNTDITMYAIAQECGFKSEIYFCRMFKNLVGCQPSRFRNELKIPEENKF